MTNYKWTQAGRTEKKGQERKRKTLIKGVLKVKRHEKKKMSVCVIIKRDIASEEYIT